MNKEDITRRTKELYTYDCVLDKKWLRCVEHDCVLKVVNMSYQSGSGLKGKSNLDMLLRSSRGIRNSRILVSDRVDNETRTTVYSEERNDISGMVGMSPNYSGEGDGLKVRGFTRWTR